MSKCLCNGGEPCKCGDNCLCKTEIHLTVNLNLEKITVKPDIAKQPLETRR